MVLRQAKKIYFSKVKETTRVSCTSCLSYLIQDSQAAHVTRTLPRLSCIYPDGTPVAKPALDHCCKGGLMHRSDFHKAVHKRLLLAEQQA